MPPDSAGDWAGYWFSEPALPPVPLDNRGDSGGRTDSGETAHLPQVEQADWHPPDAELRLRPAETPSSAPASRSSAPLIAALFVVAVISIGAGGFLIGRTTGGPSSQPQAGATTAPTTQASTATAATLASQVRAIDSLLDRSAGARDGVIAAVVNTKQCQKTGQSIQTLRAAARKRQQLVARLNKVDVNKIPGGNRAVSTLTRAWKRSAAADRAFAAWAAAVGSPGGCPKGKHDKHARPIQGKHYHKAVRKSAGASKAKERFVKLWNPIAKKAGLPSRSDDEI